jgi:hypothetical protein
MHPRAMAGRVALLWLLLALVACAQPVPVDQRDYIGHWQGEGVLLVIQATGHADYSRVRDSRRTSVEGPAHSFTTRGFKIGIGPLSAGFRVQSPPMQVNGDWRMTVDGVELTRRDPDELLQKNAPSIST